jgi:aminoglycoside phosphotransferase family enzyme
VHGTRTTDGAPTLEAKVDFLSRPAAYDPAPAAVDRRETHMSWVFLAGARVYKLKKPVQFPYLDFSTLTRREAACRAELTLNRRLAPDVYLGVVPLTAADGALAIGGDGRPVDWLVMMTRLDERCMLDRMIAERRLTRAALDRLIETLARFYHAAAPTLLAPAVLTAGWRASLAYNKQVLLDPRFKLSAGLVRRIDGAQRRFLERHGALLAMRLRHRRIVDGHGDLRPEHIWLNDRVRIIDCLEFNARLRVVDPFDEIAFLGLECERLGAGWAADYLRRRMKRALRDGPADELFAFYRCHRATLRARLAIAHLYEEHPRTPEKWPRLAAVYLALAAESARTLERMLRTPSGSGRS